MARRPRPIGGASFAIHSAVGCLLTPWLTSRANRMNPVAVFVGVPIFVAVKALCERVDDLKPVGELLGS